MTVENPLELWRLAVELSVENAAILIAGGDPSALDYEYNHFADLQMVTKRTTGHPGFDAAFAALTNAVQRNYLAATKHGDDEIPDWERTTIDVDELKAWLRSRGFTSGFFFPARTTETEAYLDQDHDHFAPELALAVQAWNALSLVQNFPKGAKYAIDQWIEVNPNAWNAKESLSTNARERITTLVNWRRGGGAPGSGD